MESTPVTPVPPVAPASLAAVLAGVSDPRQSAKVVYSLAALLALTVAAMTAGQTSVLAVARWAARQDPDDLAALGLPPNRVPAQSTLHRLFQALEVWALARQVQTAFTVVTAPSPSTLQGIAVDGKGHRGRLRRSGRSYAVHSVSAVCHTTGLVVAHEPIRDDPDITDTELPAARRLFARLDWTHRVLTGDRLYGQPWVCDAVVAAGGDYLLLVGGNQSSRLQAIMDRLPTTPSPSDARIAGTEEDGHGRTHERREVRVTAEVAGLDWPGVQQIFRLTRTWEERGTAHTSVRYGITSLSPQRAGPEAVLPLRRGHWTIENRVHRQKDGLLREDASQVHCGAGPAVLAVLRDAALNLLYLDGIRTMLAHTQALAQSPHLALALVTRPLILHA